MFVSANRYLYLNKPEDIIKIKQLNRRFFRSSVGRVVVAKTLVNNDVKAKTARIKQLFNQSNWFMTLALAVLVFVGICVYFHMSSKVEPLSIVFAFSIALSVALCSRFVGELLSYRSLEKEIAELEQLLVLIQPEEQKASDSTSQ